MKLLVKRLYCANCQKLVRGKEQKTGATLSIVCGKCQKPICINGDSGWKHIKYSV
jgi:hypothetical protein